MRLQTTGAYLYQDFLADLAAIDAAITAGGSRAGAAAREVETMLKVPMAVEWRSQVKDRVPRVDAALKALSIT